jgi:hypothetical protein
MEDPAVRERVCASHRVGLQKLITMMGRFDTIQTSGVMERFTQVSRSERESA